MTRVVTLIWTIVVSTGLVGCSKGEPEPTVIDYSTLHFTQEGAINVFNGLRIKHSDPKTQNDGSVEITSDVDVEISFTKTRYGMKKIVLNTTKPFSKTVPNKTNTVLKELWRSIVPEGADMMHRIMNASLDPKGVAAKENVYNGKSVSVKVNANEGGGYRFEFTPIPEKPALKETPPAK